MDRQNFTTLYKASGMNDTQEMPGLSGPSAPEHFKAIQDFVKVVSPITFCIGYPLNWLVFYIFSRSKLKTTSSSRYIAAIAFVDNVVIFTYFMIHLSDYYNVPVYNIYGACQFLNYFNCIGIFLSIWYVTALVIDKFIGLYWPVKRSEYCTEFRAKCVTVLFAIFSIVMYHYLLWTVGIEVSGHTTLCMPYHAPSLMETYSFLNHVDYVIVAIIPYLTIVILLGLIIVKLCTYKSNVRQVRGSLRGRLPSVNTEQEFKTMPLVIAVAVTTIALGLLLNIYRIFRIMDQNTYTVALCFYQISFACKFFSYVMTSESFRDHLTMLCRQCIYHGPGIPLCRGHSESEPTTFISVNQQTHSSTEDHCIIEGTV